MTLVFAKLNSLAEVPAMAPTAYNSFAGQDKSVSRLDSDCQNSDCHEGDFIIAIV